MSKYPLTLRSHIDDQMTNLKLKEHGETEAVKTFYEVASQIEQTQITITNDGACSTIRMAQQADDICDLKRSLDKAYRKVQSTALSTVSSTLKRKNSKLLTELNWMQEQRQNKTEFMEQSSGKPASMQVSYVLDRHKKSCKSLPGKLAEVIPSNMQDNNNKLKQCDSGPCTSTGSTTYASSAYSDGLL